MEKREAKPAASRPGLFFGWYLVGASWIMLFLTGATSAAIFFKPMLDEFGWDRATLSLVGALSLLVFAALSPFLGRLIDRFGTRFILLVCVIAQSISSAVNGVATSLWHIYIVRFLGELKPTHGTQVLINHWFLRKRGRALGIVATGVPIGVLVLSPISQFLILNWGWRPTILFWAGVTMIVLLPVTLFIRNKPADKGLFPDGELPHQDAISSLSINQDNKIAIGTSSGNSVKESFRNSSFWLLSATQLICGVGCGLMMTHTVIFATDLGYSAMIGASFLSVQGGLNLIGVLITGQMSDRISRNKVLSLTHILRSLSFIILFVSVFYNSGSLPLIYLAMALFGFGLYTTAPLSAGLVADLFGYIRMGTLIGVILSAHMIGMAIGIYSGGIAFQLTGSYFPVFLSQGTLEFLAAVFAFIIRKQVKVAPKSK